MPPDSRPLVAVVMCTWSRPELLEATIRCLESQVGVTPKLYIWNNNPQIVELIDQTVRQSTIDVDVHHHETNIGGFGRFYLAREIADEYPYIVFIDDDQTFEPTTLHTLLSEAKPQSVVGWWAFTFTGRTPNYWVRRRVKPKRAAHYIGTCGMIADSQLFKDEQLFECPKEFWFIEDLWLCYVANHLLGWNLRAAASHFNVVIDMKNQAPRLLVKKTKFLKYLIDQGWKLSPDTVRPPVVVK